MKLKEFTAELKRIRFLCHPRPKYLLCEHRGNMWAAVELGERSNVLVLGGAGNDIRVDVSGDSLDMIEARIVGWLSAA